MEFCGDVEMDLADSVPEKEKEKEKQKQKQKQKKKQKQKQKQKRPVGGVSPDRKRARIGHARIIHVAEQAALRDDALADLAEQVRLRDRGAHLAEQARLRIHSLADLAEGARLDEALTSRLAERARLRDLDLVKSVQSLISHVTHQDQDEDESVDDYDDEKEEDESSVDDEAESYVEDESSVDDEAESYVEDESEEEVQTEEDESVDYDDDEEEEETTLPRDEVVLTEEEKELTLYMEKYMMDAYGTTSLAQIDFNISTARLELYGPEDEDEDEDEHKDTEDETVIQILNDVDSKSAFVANVHCHSGNVPPVKSFLLYPWDDLECTRHDLTVRSLDIYYKRLFPNLESARRHFHHRLWNRLPEVDLQYVQLFNKLNTLFEQKSRALYLRTASSYEFMKAQEIAEDLELQKLSDDDISECAYDVFLEWDTIAAHKLRTDYDLFLLECQLRQNLSPEDFIADDPSEISSSAALFCPRRQQWEFKNWMDEEKLLEKSEEECKRLIRQRQDKKLEENCSTRIRYIKLKRALAKDLKLISEEMD